MADATPESMSTAERDAEIGRLQAVLTDHTGHVRETLTRPRIRELVSRINALRGANGWEPINMQGRTRRPKL